MISAHILFNYYIITENFINFYCMSGKNLLFFFYKTNIYELSEKGEHNIMAKIDHAAIRTKSYEDAQKFFEDVFEMHMCREIGEKPERKCWFREGIQLPIFSHSQLLLTMTSIALFPFQVIYALIIK